MRLPPAVPVLKSDPLASSRGYKLAALVHRTKQLGLKYKFSLLILLIRLVRLVVLPAHSVFTLLAADIPYDVFARRHVALVGGAFVYIDDFGEEVGFAVLAAEVLVKVSRCQLLDFKTERKRLRWESGARTRM